MSWAGAWVPGEDSFIVLEWEQGANVWIQSATAESGVWVEV